jgi:hypothetical protein
MCGPVYVKYKFVKYWSKKCFKQKVQTEMKHISFPVHFSYCV